MREILKGFNMKYRFKTTKELEGCYLASVWNGMRDIYKVTKTTPKSIELTEVSWCSDSEKCWNDPTWKPCKILFENNKPVFVYLLDKNGKHGLNKVRKIVKFDEVGCIKMLKISWCGQGFSEVIAKNDEEAKNYKFKQYWS